MPRPTKPEVGSIPITGEADPEDSTHVVLPGQHLALEVIHHPIFEFPKQRRGAVEIRSQVSRCLIAKDADDVPNERSLAKSRVEAVSGAQADVVGGSGHVWRMPDRVIESRNSNPGER